MWKMYILLISYIKYQCLKRCTGCACLCSLDDEPIEFILAPQSDPCEIFAHESVLFGGCILLVYTNKMHPPRPPLTTSVSLDSDVLSSEPMLGHTAGNQQSKTNDIQPNQVYLNCGCHFFRLWLNSTNLYRCSLSLEEKMAGKRWWLWNFPSLPSSCDWKMWFVHIKPLLHFGFSAGTGSVFKWFLFSRTQSRSLKVSSDVNSSKDHSCWPEFGYFCAVCSLLFIFKMGMATPWCHHWHYSLLCDLTAPVVSQRYNAVVAKFISFFFLGFNFLLISSCSRSVLFGRQCQTDTSQELTAWVMMRYHMRFGDNPALHASAHRLSNRGFLLCTQTSHSE